MSRSNSLLQILTLRCEAASELGITSWTSRCPASSERRSGCHVLVCRLLPSVPQSDSGSIRQVVRRRDPHLLEDESDTTDVLSTEARNRITCAIREAGG